jgi:SAM-dependent methyltransferase
VKREDWDARYAESRLWSDGPNAWVAETVAHLEPGAAVDLGAGEGRNALWLASLGWEVTAVDFSAVGLATGAARAADLGLDVEWITADATTWVSPQQVDLVVVAYLQLPRAELARAIGNAAGYLAPGGTLALVGHDRANTVGGPRDAAVLHTVEELRAACHAARPTGADASSGTGGAGPLDLHIVECRQVERITEHGVALDTVLVASAR